MDEKEKCCHDHHAHDEAHTHEFGADHAHTHEGGCCHNHEHSHEHTHTHTHEHTHDGETHTHEHEHVHSHEHDHDGHSHDHDGHTHSHDGHTHSHEHEGHTHSHGGHTHTHGAGTGSPAEVVALLTYMADHNEHHAAELADMGEKLRGLGKTEAADKIAEGVAEFAKANAKLAEALKLVKEL